MQVGYARVSTAGQDLKAQIKELKAAGCAVIYREQASGAKSDRAALKQALRRVGEGDQLMVVRLDRLARSSSDLASILTALHAKGAGFRSLRESWADTTTAGGRLMMTVFGGIAEFERELIQERMAEGRSQAVTRGVKMGRKPKLTRAQLKWAADNLALGVSGAHIAKVLGVSRMTIYRISRTVGD